MKTLLIIFAVILTAYGQINAAAFSSNVVNDEVTDEATEEPESYRGDIWRISDDELDETLQMLEEYGGKVLNHRDDLYLVMYPTSALANVVGTRVLHAPGKKGQLPRYIARPKATPSMDVARTFNGASDIHTGFGLPQPFDGTGIVIGFSDTGFDARHANFLNADGTESRVRMFSNYNISEGKIDRLTDPEEIYNFWSDNEHQTHATHVAGILSGRGTPSPYVGMAPGAEIAATTSDLSDVGILAGVEDIIAYAKSVGKPCVINLSLGNYNGPHDGTSLVCQYLDKCTEDAVICMSAGNTGGMNGHIGYTFKSDDDQLKFRLYDNAAWVYKDVISFVDIYSRDDSPTRLQLFTMDVATTGWPVNWKSPVIDFTKTPIYILTADPELDDGEGIYHYNEEFAEHFTGNIYMEGGIDPENGRYCVQMYCDAHTDIIVSNTSKWGRYQVGAFVMGDEGTQVDLFSDCQYSKFKDNAVTVLPDTEYSISDMATGHNIISVGAYWTQGGIPMYNGNTWGGGTAGEIAQYSSYGTLPDGRVTPITLAPGGPIVSSCNGKYVQAHGSGGCSWNEDNEYWAPDSGTSMASPYVAGTLATWLQANPTMSTADVREIIESTNTYSTPVSSHQAAVSANSLNEEKRLANGFFQPYTGLSMIVKNVSTDVQTIVGKSLFATYAGGELMIANPDGRDVTVKIYSVDGKKIADVSAGCESSIRIGRENLSGAGINGIGICKISAPGAPSETLKILLN